MPLSTLDPETALIVVDLQKGIIPLPFIHPIAGVIERTCALLDAFRQRNLPAALVNVAGSAPGRTEQPRRISTFSEGFSDLIPELNRQPGDIVVTKRTWGAFASTDLEAQLKAKRVTQVVVTGVATGTGVEATARQAYEAGFHVTLAMDAMTDSRPEAHAYSLAHVFPRLGETGSTQDILDLLATRSA
ncbi:cysteine hydrolase family protein [Acidipila rosea]|uniref:Nicotinamidase-related amidase n=1 Tax=Acidipila rosea TaxID=768535 RepID=A0A4R1L3M8_9BACT|nr:cysteine hydrolase [Acidipila rosea]MBW4028485.1 cysteine hydrolase [Acidobacteriota bacterium]MBW4045874.1 cysteine hydrolase [Acidobacteriota bacterium]TCK71677.1 nicotinamidase-related amidase [Acidipila rosea]